MGRAVIASVSDMIFSSKIRGSAEALDIGVTFVRSIENLVEKSRAQRPDLIILDLNTPRFDSVAAITQLKSDPEIKNIPVVGFLSHVQVDLYHQAQNAGCDYVMPRSRFTADLPDILNGDI